ncbi:MAG: hypothetical protein KGH79_00830 [Patescibacteria group bacterium]|nr:hypothetical protein [Patescibacteria group bacterium]
MKKLYVGCSLTQAPEDFKQRVEDLKNLLRKDFEILDFIGVIAGTPADVYLWDIHECVAKCDVFIAICDYPAIGLGYELGVAVEQLKKPTLALAHKDAKISRLLLGIELPYYKFARYENMGEIPKILADFIDKI